MYGGGFATVPAYLRDLFGTKQVGAIHGRLLTAWSTAAIVGPTVVTYAREYQVARQIPKADSYSMTMYGLAALLAIGAIANSRIVTRTSWVSPANDKVTASTTVDDAPLPLLRLVLTWTVVAIPMAWGVAQVVMKSFALFR
jgi:hypothetical protein